jgi:predicted GTPase
LTKIDYAIMECDHPLGEKGLHVVDTLGFRAGRKAEEITKEFLTKTDALLFVIRAHPLFEEEDEGFLKMQLRLNESRLEHIFFVINDFSGLNETERLQVRENARTRLRDYFLTPEGDLDESLFARRVFSR